MFSPKFSAASNLVNQSANAPGKPINGQSSCPPHTKEVADQEVGTHDPFALEHLRLSQDFPSMVHVEKVITTVPCRKPNRQEFVRVRAGDDWRLQTIIFDDKIGHQTYLVDPQLRGELAAESIAVCLMTAITKQGDLFLWPVRLPNEDGRSNTWTESGIAAARTAEEDWIRVTANMNASCYNVHRALGDLGEPIWPDLSFQQLLRLCFKDRFIRDFEHPVLRNLRGES